MIVSYLLRRDSNPLGRKPHHNKTAECVNWEAGHQTLGIDLISIRQRDYNAKRFEELKSQQP